MALPAKVTARVLDSPLWLAADFHLVGDGAGCDDFEELLQRAQSAGAHLCLLGDVFHTWYGPQHLKLEMYQRELEVMRQATDAGLVLTLLPGNRDFLLDDGFTRRTGVEVLGDEFRVTLKSTSIHLSHGDLFATADVRYQRMRRVIRSRMIRFLARALPEPVVRRMAFRLRRHSEQVVRQKTLSTLEPDVTEVKKHLDSGCSTVVCGHFHRYRNQVLESRQGPGQFIVLEPFEDRGFYLVHEGERWTEHRLCAEPIP